VVGVSRFSVPDALRVSVFFAWFALVLVFVMVFALIHIGTQNRNNFQHKTQNKKYL